MMTQNSFIHILIACLLLSFKISTAYKIKYVITNNATNLPGGKRFDAELGYPFTAKLLETIPPFIWRLFRQSKDADRKYVPEVIITIENFDDAWAVTTGNKIEVSAPTLARLDDLKFLFKGLMYHEMTHVFQWTGEGTTPVGLIEGIAEYTKLQAKLYNAATFPKPGDGNKWDEGYGQTARFLEYCNSLKQGFVADLNKMMKKVYKEEYFKQLVGKPVDQLWKEYKAKYGKTNVSYEPLEEQWVY